MDSKITEFIETLNLNDLDLAKVKMGFRNSNNIAEYETQITPEVIMGIFEFQFMNIYLAQSKHLINATGIVKTKNYTIIISNGYLLMKSNNDKTVIFGNIEPKTTVNLDSGTVILYDVSEDHPDNLKEFGDRKIYIFIALIAILSGNTNDIKRLKYLNDINKKYLAKIESIKLLPKSDVFINEIKKYPNEIISEDVKDKLKELFIKKSKNVVTELKTGNHVPKELIIAMDLQFKKLTTTHCSVDCMAYKAYKNLNGSLPEHFLNIMCPELKLYHEFKKQRIDTGIDDI